MNRHLVYISSASHSVLDPIAHFESIRLGFKAWNFSSFIIKASILVIMSVNAERRLTVKIPHKDMENLSKNQFQLQVAKSVITRGECEMILPRNNENLRARNLTNILVTYNLVWKSSVLAPYIDVFWRPVYGFNWTSDVPADGISVSCHGDWMQCNFGQALDIDSNGFFVPSTVKADTESMMIGKNGYKAQSSDGIRIVIGVQKGKGTFEPIFVDPVSINKNMSATFQPQEKLEWWYDSGAKQATMYTNHTTPFETGDFSSEDAQTHTYTKMSSYDVQSGKWTTTATKCKSMLGSH